MRVLFDNVDTRSSSGPNSFGRKLINEMNASGHYAGVDTVEPDVQLSFIQIGREQSKKIALRLDGIYFNNKQDWERMNDPIKQSVLRADLVIYQTQFNKRLTEKYFGESKRSAVISNGTCLEDIRSVDAISHPALEKFEEVWCCSSSWRPHKRLSENIRYFQENAPKNSCLVVLGENPDHQVKHDNIMYTGKLPWEACISIYKRSKKFIHLAFLDHCPNVVVDARASGCDVVVSSSGGTREIAGPDATIVEDIDWDLRPLDLYSPPRLDFSKTFKNGVESNIDVKDVSKKYIDSLQAL